MTWLSHHLAHAPECSGWTSKGLYFSPLCVSCSFSSSNPDGTWQTHPFPWTFPVYVWSVVNSLGWRLNTLICCCGLGPCYATSTGLVCLVIDSMKGYMHLSEPMNRYVTTLDSHGSSLKENMRNTLMQQLYCGIYLCLCLFINLDCFQQFLRQGQLTFLCRKAIGLK